MIAAAAIRLLQWGGVRCVQAIRQAYQWIQLLLCSPSSNNPIPSCYICFIRAHIGHWTRLPCMAGSSIEIVLTGYKIWLIVNKLQSRAYSGGPDYRHISGTCIDESVCCGFDVKLRIGYLFMSTTSVFKC
jgi:hypothetical protein